MLINFHAKMSIGKLILAYEDEVSKLYLLIIALFILFHW